jgi:enoyl-CoA hydratase/carnithine racemase
MTEPLRRETVDHVRVLTLTRAREYNTINPELRDALSEALDEAEYDRSVSVVLLQAEGPAFCAGYQLDWATASQAGAEAASERVWDSVADVQMIGRYAATWAKLHTLSKPTVAAVQGWCIAGGTNLVLHADLIVCAESARFGYPPLRVWGIPEAPWVWIARLGLERAKRFLFTGDEITGARAAELGLVLECVSDDRLAEHTLELARRIARVPLEQLQMMKWALHDTARQMYAPDTSRLLGCLFDGVARHTQEGLDFVARSVEAGFRQAVRERDDPFGDYGSRPRQP